jgi:Zn-dependent peptidase ImmA (M78 family)
MNIGRMHEIQKAADIIRAICQETSYGIKDIFGSCEKIGSGYKLIRYPFNQSKILGLAAIYQGDSIIITNTSEILSREIFSAAHEIGHMRLHLSGCNKAILDKTFADDQGIETEANYFAACLLMPKIKLQEYIETVLETKPSELSEFDAARLQSEFSVSYDALINRLEFVDIINSQKAEELRATKREITVHYLLKAVGGNMDLCEATYTKKLPPDFFKWAVELHDRKIIPHETLKKAFEYAGVEDTSLQKGDEAIPDDNIDLDDLFRGLTDGSVS